MSGAVLTVSSFGSMSAVSELLVVGVWPSDMLPDAGCSFEVVRKLFENEGGEK